MLKSIRPIFHADRGPEPALNAHENEWPIPNGLVQTDPETKPRIETVPL